MSATHLLIREREDTIGMAIKRIASSYVYYYNHKYSRDGHLFRERYKSEPVNDMAYFALFNYLTTNFFTTPLSSRKMLIPF